MAQKLIRLQRYLAQAGVAARRKAEVLITEGRVKVNGKIESELGFKVDPDSAQVTVDNQAVALKEFVYIVLNKPKACLTTLSDPQGRRTVMEYVPSAPAGVVPVGRLDFYSEGVLLFTNDGDLSARLQSPEHHVEKTYHVKIRGQVTEQQLDRLRRGVHLGGGVHTRAAQIDRLKGTKSRHDWLVVTLIEGRSRQIHRMFEVIRHTVVKLQRVAYAGISFHGLRVGDARELTQAEVNALHVASGTQKNQRAVSQGKWKVLREETDDRRRLKDRERLIPTPNKTPGGSKRGNAKLSKKFAKGPGPTLGEGAEATRENAAALPLRRAKNLKHFARDGGGARGTGGRPSGGRSGSSRPSSGRSSDPHASGGRPGGSRSRSTGKRSGSSRPSGGRSGGSRSSGSRSSAPRTSRAKGRS